MIRKRDLVDLLFLIGFAVYGLGNYIGLKQGLSKGLILSNLPFLAILLFYAVDAVYRKAIALGAQDEGPAGPRGDSFYAGYFRDPDGNKLNVFCVPKPA